MDNYGVYALFLVYIQYFLLLVDFGYALTATRETVLAKDDKALLSKVFFTTVFAKLLLCVVGVIIATVVLSIYGDSKLYILALIAFFSVIGNALFPVWFFQGLEKMKYLSIVSVLSRTLVLLSTVIFVKTKSDMSYALAIYSLTFVFPSIILNIKIWKMKVINFYIPTVNDVLQSLKSSFPLFVSNFAISFYTNFNAILLSRYEPVNIVGSYFSADRVRLAAQNILTPVSQAIYPTVCDSTKKGNLTQLIKYGAIFIGFGCTISLGILLLGKPVGLIYFGKDNYLAAHYFQLMFPIIGIVSIAMVFGHWFMAGNGHNKQLSYIYTFFSIVHLLYAFPFVKHMGAVGMIYSSILTQGLIALSMVVFFIEKKRRNALNAK
ncbi:hypothetical protein ASF13_19335 [Erwinia sp. Leaf53]|nr:hypothetical protein ASF13_19335 [Erwinia sp. Leaf53]